jgi:mono/diheme cytochrome c family protein
VFEEGSAMFELTATLCLSLALGAPVTPAEETRPVAQGSLLFRVHCRNCHGETGRGDGPTAPLLKIAPPDLTRIRERNRGVFPSEAVRETIDGRRTSPAHGESQMPIWGFGLQELDRDADQEAALQQRIQSLIEFLESIQRSGEISAR